MEKLIQVLTDSLVTGIARQPFIVHVLMSFIIVEGACSYFVIKWLLERWDEAKEETQGYRDLSNRIFKEAVENRERR